MSLLEAVVLLRVSSSGYKSCSVHVLSAQHDSASWRHWARSRLVGGASCWWRSVYTACTAVTPSYCSRSVTDAQLPEEFIN